MVRSDTTLALLKVALRMALNLLYGGVAWGAIAGYFGLATASGEAAVAKNSASLILGLLIVLPLALAVQIWLSLRGNALDRIYAVPVRAYTLMAVAGLLGGIGGVLGFLVSATIIPSIFGKLDSAALGTNLRDTVDLLSIILIILLTFFAGLGLAGWATRTRRPGQRIS